MLFRSQEYIDNLFVFKPHSPDSIVKNLNLEFKISNSKIAIDAGVLNINALPKVQQNYFNSCKVAAHNAATKLRSLKSSAKLSGDLNSIYSREGK